MASLAARFKDSQRVAARVGRQSPKQALSSNPLHQLLDSIFDSTDPGQHHPPCICWEPLVKKQEKGIKPVPDTQWVLRIRFTQAASGTVNAHDHPLRSVNLPEAKILKKARA